MSEIGKQFVAEVEELAKMLGAWEVRGSGDEWGESSYYADLIRKRDGFGVSVHLDGHKKRLSFGLSAIKHKDGQKLIRDYLPYDERRAYGYNLATVAMGRPLSQVAKTILRRVVEPYEKWYHKALKDIYQEGVDRKNRLELAQSMARIMGQELQTRNGVHGAPVEDANSWFIYLDQGRIEIPQYGSIKFDVAIDLDQAEKIALALKK